ncbi:MAG: PE family protein [Mycobacterium sp.]
MTYVVAAPELVTAAAHDLATIGSNLGSANESALAMASAVAPPGSDEVSLAVAALFDGHAQAYQALSAQAELFHQQFVQLMSGGAGAYAATEAANALPLNAIEQGALGAISAASVSSGLPVGAAGTVPAAAVPAGFSPATLISGVPTALATVSAPAAAAVQAATPSLFPMVPAGLAAGTQFGAPAAGAAAAVEQAAAPVGVVEAETASFAPASALPWSFGTPVAAAPASRAYTPATPAYSPEQAAAAEE